MSARSLAYRVQGREGWTDTTLIDVLLDYIDLTDLAVFNEYLGERSASDPED
jgi:hypothetical protein